MKNLTIKNVTFGKPRHVWDILASFYQITGKPLKKKKKKNSNFLEHLNRQHLTTKM